MTNFRAKFIIESSLVFRGIYLTQPPTTGCGRLQDCSNPFLTCIHATSCVVTRPTSNVGNHTSLFQFQLWSIEQQAGKWWTDSSSHPPSAIQHQYLLSRRERGSFSILVGVAVKLPPQRLATDHRPLATKLTSASSMRSRADRSSRWPTAPTWTARGWRATGWH